jgi:hypothetical protein
MNEKRYRLRKDDKIVGYRKVIGKSEFFSKDEYAWGGIVIDYLQADLFTGKFDMDRKAIYAEDIIESKNNEETEYALVVYDDLLDQFSLYTIDGDKRLSHLSMDLLDPANFRRKSYSFLQKNEM